MNKSEYALLLEDKRWQVVRRSILKRDGFHCKGCGKGDCKLNVHHKIYIDNKMPWEVPAIYLVTLCDECHSKAHEGRTISSFIRKKEEIKRKKRQKSVFLNFKATEMLLKLEDLLEEDPTNNLWKQYKCLLLVKGFLEIRMKDIVNVAYKFLNK